VDVRALSLCAGVGGIDLGLRIANPGIRTVCYVENANFPAAVLAARMEDKTLAPAPVWDDVGTFDGRPWRGRVDLITAGFPCQPVSLAGKRAGMDDKRFIWGDIARIIGEVRPRYVFLENVPGILTADRGAFLDCVLSSLVQLGFDCEWDLFSAEETGAPHKRQRWFCLAYTNSQPIRADRSRGDACPPRTMQGNGEQRQRVRPDDGDVSRTLADARHGLVPFAGRGSQGRNGAGPAGTVLGNADGAGREEHGGPEPVRPQQSPAQRRGGPVADAALIASREPHNQDDTIPDRGQAGTIPISGRVYPPARNDRSGWATVEASFEPAVCRDADGLAPGLDPALFAYRNDRLRTVGNGVVPLTAAIAWLKLMERVT
jgi:DNA (cytosine-5)-methyltransferase 1